MLAVRQITPILAFSPFSGDDYGEVLNLATVQQALGNGWEK